MTVDQPQYGLESLSLGLFLRISFTPATMWFGWDQYQSLNQSETCWSKSPKGGLNHRSQIINQCLVFPDHNSDFWVEHETQVGQIKMKPKLFFNNG